MIFGALLLLSSSAGQAYPVPTAREFVAALAKFTGKHVKEADVKHVACESIGAEEPTEAECAWHQLIGGKWKRYSTYVAIDGRGWQLIDEPNPKR